MVLHQGPMPDSGDDSCQDTSDRALVARLGAAFPCPVEWSAGFDASAGLAISRARIRSERSRRNATRSNAGVPGVHIMRKCSFCAASASTKEDAWPNWLARNSPAGVEIEGQRGRQPTLRWTSQRHALRVGAVCGSCNNGWMSDLENLAKAVIEPLLRSHQYLFASAEKRNLARWTLKSAMVFESLGVRREPFYTQYERDAVRAGELPPGYHALWVGRCVDLNGLYCNAADLFDHREPSLSDTTDTLRRSVLGPSLYRCCPFDFVMACPLQRALAYRFQMALGTKSDLWYGQMISEQKYGRRRGH